MEFFIKNYQGQVFTCGIRFLSAETSPSYINSYVLLYTVSTDTTSGVPNVASGGRFQAYILLSFVG